MVISILCARLVGQASSLMRPLHHRVLPTTLEDSILVAYVPRLLSVSCAQFQRAGRDTAYCRRNTESTIIKLWRPMAALKASPLPFGIGVRSLCTPASSPRCGLPACLTRMVKSEQCLQSAVHCVSVACIIAMDEIGGSLWPDLYHTNSCHICCPTAVRVSNDFQTI